MSFAHRRREVVARREAAIARRAAIFAIRGFFRRVRAVADDRQGDRTSRAATLDRWRHDLDALYTGGDPGEAAMLAEAVQRFALDRADFAAVIDGAAMDVERDICWPTLAVLDLYCDRVASAEGRLLVRVLGMASEPGMELAHHLGRALPFTGILRDIDKKAAIGRVYLPEELLRAAGIALSLPAIITDPRLDQAVRPLAAQAHEHYRAAETLLATRPAGHLLAPRLAVAAYSRLLRRMETAGWAPPRARVRVGKPLLFWTLLRLLVTR